MQHKNAIQEFDGNKKKRNVLEGSIYEDIQRGVSSYGFEKSILRLRESQ
ncbi:hypothetical protein ABH966_000154 [Lysinibacillus sp. RC46]